MFSGGIERDQWHEMVEGVLLFWIREIENFIQDNFGV